jgi:VanZ family protein
MSKNSLGYLISRWGPALLVMVIIFLASSTPGKDMPSFGLWDTLVKKGGHMTGYFLLTLGMLRGLHRPLWKTSLIALGLVLLYAAGDEFHQSFVAGRNSTPVDVGIDMVGAFFAAFLYRTFTRFRLFIFKGLE